MKRYLTRGRVITLAATHWNALHWWSYWRHNKTDMTPVNLEQIVKVGLRITIIVFCVVYWHIASWRSIFFSYTLSASYNADLSRWNSNFNLQNLEFKQQCQDLYRSPSRGISVAVLPPHNNVPYITPTSISQVQHLSSNIALSTKHTD